MGAETKAPSVENQELLTALSSIKAWSRIYPYMLHPLLPVSSQPLCSWSIQPHLFSNPLPTLTVSGVAHVVSSVDLRIKAMLLIITSDWCQSLCWEPVELK